jgi:hypothetical protein
LEVDVFPADCHAKINACTRWTTRLACANVWKWSWQHLIFFDLFLPSIHTGIFSGDLFVGLEGLAPLFVGEKDDKLKRMEERNGLLQTSRWYKLSTQRKYYPR